MVIDILSASYISAGDRTQKLGYHRLQKSRLLETKRPGCSTRSPSYIFVRDLIGNECRPAFAVFISPQAGKVFEVLVKSHSISRRLKCLLYFIFLLVGPACRVVARRAKPEAFSED